MPWLFHVASFALVRLNPVVWKAQRFASKVEIGLFLYTVGAILVCGENLFNLLLIGVFYIRPDLRLLRWAKRHGDEEFRGVLPTEYIELALQGAMEVTIGAVALAFDLFLGLVIGLAIGFSPPPAEGATPPAWLVSLFHSPLFWQLVPGWLYPFGFLFMGLGFLVLACRPRPRSERFSFSRWLKNRRARATSPVLLEIRR